MNIIIFGDDGCGKSTLAKALSLLDPNISVVALADTLRMDLSEKYPKMDFISKPTPPFCREKMIETSQEVKKSNQLYYCIKALEKANKGNKETVIDDGRFWVEYSFFKKLGFTTVGIKTKKPSGYLYAEELENIIPLCDFLLESRENTPYIMAKKILDTIKKDPYHLGKGLQ